MTHTPTGSHSEFWWIFRCSDQIIISPYWLHKTWPICFPFRDLGFYLYTCQNMNLITPMIWLKIKHLIAHNIICPSHCDLHLFLLTEAVGDENEYTHQWAHFEEVLLKGGIFEKLSKIPPLVILAATDGQNN